MNSYIDLVINFSSTSYEQILENQEIAAKNQKNMGFKLTDEIKEKLIEKLNKKRIITYEEIKPSIILFNKKPQDITLTKCSIITTFKEGDEEYEQLSELYKDYLKDETYLNSLNEFYRPEFIKELRCICSTPISIGEK